MEGLRTLVTSAGAGGWMRVEGVAGLPGLLYVRFSPDPAGRLRVHELYCDSSQDSALSLTAIRSIPIPQIEAICNEDPVMNGFIRARMHHPAPDLSLLASYFATGFGDYDDHERMRSDWVRLSFLSHYRFNDNALAEGGYEDVARHRPKRADHGPTTSPSAAPDFRLTHAPGPDGLTDDFLRQVSRAYFDALRRGERPNRTISHDVSASVRTVQGWVYEARKRGIMPPARKGAAG